MAYNCHKLKLKKGFLEYTFKTFKGQDEDMRPIINEINHKIKIT